MNYKSINTKVKDVDSKQGIVTFYTSVFDVKDSDGDIVQKGAFKKTLSESFDRLRHFKDHRIAVGLPIKGETFEDDYGLRVSSKLFKGVQDADELLIQYETYADLGNGMEHSFGYNTIKEDFDKERNANILKELKVFEFTTMTSWGANQYARQVGVKSQKDLLIELTVLKRMLKGDFKDYRLEQYEQQILQIENILKGMEPEKQSDTRIEPSAINTTLAEKKLFITKLLNYGL